MNAAEKSKSNANTHLTQEAVSAARKWDLRVFPDSPKSGKLSLACLAMIRLWKLRGCWCANMGSMICRPPNTDDGSDNAISVIVPVWTRLSLFLFSELL